MTARTTPAKKVPAPALRETVASVKAQWKKEIDLISTRLNDAAENNDLCPQYLDEIDGINKGLTFTLTKPNTEILVEFSGSFMVTTDKLAYIARGSWDSTLTGDARDDLTSCIIMALEARFDVRGADIDIDSVTVNS